MCIKDFMLFDSLLLFFLLGWTDCWLHYTQTAARNIITMDIFGTQTHTHTLHSPLLGDLLSAYKTVPILLEQYMFSLSLSLSLLFYFYLFSTHTIYFAFVVPAAIQRPKRKRKKWITEKLVDTRVVSPNEKRKKTQIYLPFMLKHYVF